ncbi:MAG: M42 family metallopeptidase [Chloroflexia bacterium]|nr:M42 family metallopeptidase [Chloroflexia bacterium]
MHRYMQDIAEITQDQLGSFVAKLPGPEDGPRVMLAGHMDEVGFMVRQISEEGFLRFLPLGGWWDLVILGQRMTILSKNGPVVGIAGAKPPHMLSKEERDKIVEKKDMYIDVGATSSEEVEQLGIRVGDPIVPVSPFTVMGIPQSYLGKAFDNRVGCALAMETLREMANRERVNSLYAVGTVQEEVGLRGAKTSAHLVNPDVAIILEVDIAGDVPGIKKEESSVKLGGGPSMLVYDARMIPNLHLRDLVIETAEEADIPLQLSVMMGGATDGGMIHLHNSGVPSVVLAVPTRHIHSHSSIIRREDYDNTLKLLLALVQKLDRETVAGL